MLLGCLGCIYADNVHSWRQFIDRNALGSCNCLLGPQLALARRHIEGRVGWELDVLVHVDLGMFQAFFAMSAKPHALDGTNAHADM